MSAYMHGHAVGANMALYGTAKPGAVSIPTEYLGGSGDLPKAWDGWTVAAHEYAAGVGAGHARVVADGKFGVAAPGWSQVPE
jgi:hypothetical protein